MLLNSIALSTIASALKVSYNTVYYYKQRLNLLSLVLIDAVAVTVSCKRAFKLSIDKVLLFNILCIYFSVN
jgi:hypothetical protein